MNRRGRTRGGRCSTTSSRVPTVLGAGLRTRGALFRGPGAVAFQLLPHCSAGSQRVSGVSWLTLSPLSPFPFILLPITMKLPSSPPTVKVAHHRHAVNTSLHLTPYLTFWQRLTELTAVSLRASKAGPSWDLFFHRIYQQPKLFCVSPH